MRSAQWTRTGRCRWRLIPTGRHRTAALLDCARHRHFALPRRGEPAMLDSKTFDDLAARIGRAIESSPAKDVEKNVRAMLSAGLARLDLVPRAEFDVQAQVLLKTREKLEALEQRLAELEARYPPPEMK